MHETTPHNPVTSRNNQTLKKLRALSEPKHRRQEQSFLVEGVKTVEEALRDDLGVSMVVASPSLLRHHGRGVLRLAETRRVPVLWVGERLLDGLAESKTPQPIMAVVRMRGDSEEVLWTSSSGLIVIAHQLQDPGNLGMLIRTAAAAGASGVAVTAQTVDPYNPKAVRASMGSILRLPVVQVADAVRFIGECRKRGFQTAATVVTGDKTHFEADLKKPTAVVFGQEASGLPQDLLAGIDLRLRIPMADSIDSLNVAAASAVVLYEAVRQRTVQEPAGKASTSRISS